VRRQQAELERLRRDLDRLRDEVRKRG